MIERPDSLDRLLDAFRRGRVVALLGPRQCGKTTLARQIVAADSPNYFDSGTRRHDLASTVSVVPLGEVAQCTNWVLQCGMADVPTPLGGPT